MHARDTTSAGGESSSNSVHNAVALTTLQRQSSLLPTPASPKSARASRHDCESECDTTSPFGPMPPFQRDGPPHAGDALLAEGALATLDAVAAGRGEMQPVPVTPTLLAESTPEGVIEERLIPLLAMLALCSMAGDLVRVGLQAFYGLDAGQVVFPAVYANFVGCLLAGIATQRKHQLVALYYPLFGGATTGLTGSITTFSGWNTAAVFAALGQSEPHEPAASRAVRWLSIMLVGFAVAHFGYLLGVAVGQGAWWGGASARFSPAVVTRPAKWYAIGYVDAGVLLLALACWVAAVVVAFLLFSSDPLAVAASVAFAPVGTLVRWFLGIKLNQQRMPLGTLLANFLGTGIATVLVALQQRKALSIETSSLFQGLIIGFCGCLTTVSTFVVELHTIRRSAAVRYGVITMLASQALSFIIAAAISSTGI